MVKINEIMWNWLYPGQGPLWSHRSWHHPRSFPLFGKKIDINGRATTPNYQIVVGYHPHFCYFKLLFLPYVLSKIKNLCWQNLLMVKSHLFRACRGSSNELAMATPPRHSRGRAAAAVEPVSNETMRRQGREPPGGFRSKKTRPGRQKCPELWMGFCWNSDLRFWLCVFVGEKLLAQELKRLGIFWVASSWGGLKRTCLPRISHVCYSNPLCFLVQPLFFGRKSLWCVFSQWNSCFLLAKI